MRGTSMPARLAPPLRLMMPSSSEEEEEVEEATATAEEDEEEARAVDDDDDFFALAEWTNAGVDLVAPAVRTGLRE